MEPRFYKYWYSKGNYHMYKISSDGKIQKLLRKDAKWFDVDNGHFSKLHQDRMEEVSLEEWFLEIL